MAKKDKKLKTACLQVRMTALDLETLHKKVAGAGLKVPRDTGKYVRHILSVEDGAPLFFRPDDIEKMQFIYGNIARVGGLLNQITRVLNTDYVKCLYNESDEIQVDVNKLASVISDLEKEVINIKYHLADLSEQQVE